jgi:hypothetical protein
MASASLYLRDQKPVSGQGDSSESFPIIYRFPLHTTVLLIKGTNQMNPMIRSLTGAKKYQRGFIDNAEFNVPLSCNLLQLSCLVINLPIHISPRILRELTNIAKDMVIRDGS